MNREERKEGVEKVMGSLVVMFKALNWSRVRGELYKV